MAGPRLLAGRYRLDERIGSGGMGVVWRAHDERLKRTVAVKQLVLGQGLSASDADEGRARAMREGRIAARLQHPHAINVFDVALGPDLEGGEDSQPWLVMEYLPSRSLADVLAERGPMPPQEVAEIGRQLADALAAAHRAGIVHRDVKPGNVLLGENGTVKITDFGISRANWDVTVTRTGILSGTPAFFAPEVARGEAPDPASDVFALGSTLYTAVEGQPPFGLDPNTLALLRSVAEGRIRPPHNAGALHPLLMQLLRYEPDQRPVMVVVRDMLGVIAKGGGAQRAAPAAPAVRSVRTALPVPAALPVGTASSVRTAPPVRTGPPARTATQAPPARPRAGRPWWRRLRVLAAAALLVVIAVGGVLIANALGVPDEPTSAAPAPASAPASDPGPTAPPTSDPGMSATEPEATTQEATTQEATTTTTSPAPEPGPEGFVQVVQTYYALLPDQLDEAYSYLGPDVQAQAGGRGGYENFWSRFSDVGTENVRADGTTVTLTIVYTNTDGSSFTEPYVLEMGIAEDGSILIVGSEIGGPG